MVRVGVLTISTAVVLCLLNHVGLVKGDAHFTNEWAAVISGGPNHAESVAKRHGYEVVASMPYFDDHYVLKRSDVPHRSKRSSHHHTKRLIEDEHVGWAEQQVSRTRVKRSLGEYHARRDGSPAFNDPIYPKQWYLGNVVPTQKDSVSDLGLRHPLKDNPGNSYGRTQRGHPIHLDLQVMGAWEKGLTGKDVVVCVLDDGIEKNNTDLADNYDPYASYDLNDNDNDPHPRYDESNENKHGTRCAGEIAMVANNGVCGVGIAFNSKIGGVRMLDGKVTDSLEARALSFNISHVDIFSASWGPNDDGVTVEGPGNLASKALVKGVTEGRDGKGVIYSWAAGNGGRMEDNCNCDGYTSSIYTLSVNSVSQQGEMPWYSEQCSSTLAATYSSGNGGDNQVVSSDLRNMCTTHHTGTSAAAPMAAGIFALLLEANTNVTWRDVQHLVALTSRMGPLANADGWYQNAAGFCVNPAFGFGLMDANSLVTEGSTWVNVGEQHKCQINASSKSNLPQELTSGHYAEVLVETNGCAGQSNEVNFLEHVEFVFTMDYSRRGAISVTVVSPSGTTTKLMRTRQYDKSTLGFQQWPLMSVHTWGEDPNGIWRFRVSDEDTTGKENGTLKDLKMVLYGTKETPHYRRNGPVTCDVDLDARPSHAPSQTLSQEQRVEQLLQKFMDPKQQRSLPGSLPDFLENDAEPALRE